MNNETSLLSNDEIAARLDEAGKLLETQGANPFRASAYRKAADTIRNLPRPVGRIASEQGVDGLKELPAIGDSLASSLERLIKTGEFTLLERLRGRTSPESVLSTIGGIGPKLARRLYDEVGIHDLTELEQALSSGKLDRLPGFGEKRLRAVRESVFGRLQRLEESQMASDRSPRKPERAVPNEPPVAVILDIDREYARKVKARALPRITPKKFNPLKEPWLPILTTERDGASYTALYSNTKRAHELGVTNDWVVVYRDERDGSGQWTVITSQYGATRGRRIIRGREQECKDHYRRLERGLDS